MTVHPRSDPRIAARRQVLELAVKESLFFRSIVKRGTEGNEDLVPELESPDTCTRLPYTPPPHVGGGAEGGGSGQA